MFFNKNKTKKSNSRKFVESMCAPPNSQITEVLYELMANYKKGMTRLEITTQCHVLNPPEAIRRLRQKGVDIAIELIVKTNKYGREVKYGRYYLVDFKNAAEIYPELIKDGLLLNLHVITPKIEI